MTKILLSDPDKLHKIRKKQYETNQAYRLSFLDKKTKYYKKKFTTRRNCPVCNHKDSIILFKKDGGVFVKCKKCSMVYLNPVFKDKALIDYYKNNSDNQHLACIQSPKFYTSIYGAGISMINKKLKKKDLHILDVGCCSGFFLDMCKKINWQTIGLELNKTDIEIAQKNHEIWSTPLESIKTKKKFDVITFWDCFEHLKHPKKILTKCFGLLKKKGVIFFQIPNSDSFAAKILRDKCNMFDTIEHVNLFNKKSFNYLIKKSKYKLIKIKSVIDELNVTKKYLNYEDPYYGTTENLTKMNFLNEKNIHSNFLGYKLQILIQKK